VGAAEIAVTERGVIVATHQPIFLPWPGLFHKLAYSDCLVLLDDVQFPRGRTWLTRNRLKHDGGELWLTVPVKKKGRGLQRVRHVEIDDRRGWRRKHLEGIRQSYAHAPYFAEHFERIESIYARKHALLADLATELIEWLGGALSLQTRVVRQSQLSVTGKGTDLLARICEHLGANRLLVLASAEKHIDARTMRAHEIDVVRAAFRPPVYPQLWGDFIYNLSTLDLLLNCGPKSRDVVT
jgi:hypothetical protein